MAMKRFSTWVAMICIVLLHVPHVSAQKTAIRVDGQDVLDLITYMSTDEQLGRKPLTPEFFRLHEWAANKFKKWGLEPAGDDGTYFGAVPITGPRGTYAFGRGTPKLVINNREFFTKFGDFSVDYRSTQNKIIEANVVFVGYGISAPQKGLDEYDGVNVRGRIVIAFKGSPNDAKPVRGFFTSSGEGEKVPTEDWSAESKDSTKIMIAYEKGAAGIMLYNPERDSDGAFRFRRMPVYESPFERDFIVVSDINERVFLWMFWKDPQESERAFNRRINNIRLDIKKKKVHSFETGIKVKVKGFEKTTLYGEKFDNHMCRNVLAKITGSDPVLKNEYIVLGGHFDHLGVRNGQVYNGADDDASGSGVVMEVARLMGEHNIRPKRTVIFALWTGEELGLIGSRYWGNNPTDGMTMDQVVTNFNMDMVGLGDKIGGGGALNFPSIWEVVKRDQDQDILDVMTPREGGAGGSDHTPFIERGIESIFLITSGGIGHPDYHDFGDDSDKIDKEILRKVGQFVLQGAINVGNEPGTLVIPDRQHIYDGMQWHITALNPELKMEAGWKVLEAKTKSDLANLIIEKVEKLKKPAQPSPRMRFMRRMPSAKFYTGIAGGQVFDYDTDFMKIAYSALGFGRIDVDGDDGKWFDRGLTDCGREALRAMEDSSIVLHLVNPSKETFADVLTSAQKPFVVTGISDLDADQISLMNEKNVLVAVDFDPANVDGCVSMLEELKTKIGDRDNLIINLQSKEEVGKAKKDLYRHLIGKGWTKKEIYAVGGSGTSRGSVGNFSVLVPKR